MPIELNLKPTQQVMTTIQVVFDAAKDKYLMYLDGQKKGTLDASMVDGSLDAVKYCIEMNVLFFD